MKKLATALVFAFAATSPAAAIDIVGSSTVYPFSAVAAELFALSGGGKAPKVEATGSGGGLKLFCAGGDSPDITNASRRIKKSEQKLCAENGVREILEIKIGYDGIVVARSAAAESFDLTRRDLFLALARQTPDAAGNLIDNSHRTWRDADASLPGVEIRVYGPPPTSGTRDAFAELVLEKGCDSHPQLKALKKSDKSRHRAVCHGVREDGAYIESGENDNLIIQKLAANPDALGIFGFSFLEENRDKVRGLSVEGVAPEFDAVADGSYPVSRPLFFYANLARYDETPGLREFVEFFVSEDVMGEDGALTDRGLIPLPPDEYAAAVRAAQTRTPMEKL
ncbi:MAG: PstS family phosphate ABC transporter substrate-binding protein [Gammaproteobacteria bacterium]